MTILRNVDESKSSSSSFENNRSLVFLILDIAPWKSTKKPFVESNLISLGAESRVKVLILEVIKFPLA